MECTYIHPKDGLKAVKANDNLKVLQCEDKTHHSESFVFKRGDQYIKRTMCVQNPPVNRPTEFFYDKKCEGL